MNASINKKLMKVVVYPLTNLQQQCQSWCNSLHFKLFLYNIPYMCLTFEISRSPFFCNNFSTQPLETLATYCMVSLPPKFSLSLLSGTLSSYLYLCIFTKPVFLTSGSITILDMCLASIIGSNPTKTTTSWLSSPRVKFQYDHVILVFIVQMVIY